MIVFWICSVISVSSAILATFAGDLRISILALWVTGLGIGGIQLSLGAEFLALVQWILSTLSTLALLSYAITFGEHGVPDPRSASARAAAAIFPSLLGLAFAAVIWLGTKHLPIAGVLNQVQGQDLAGLGKALLDRHLLSLELIAVLLFLAVVGAGVLARPEGGRS